MTLSGASLARCDLASALKAECVEVELDPVSRGQTLCTREAGLEILESNPGTRAYGWNRAFGPFKGRRLEPEEQLRLQANVLRSHSTGLGKGLPHQVSRLVLTTRASCLAKGISGAHPELVERMNNAVSLRLIPAMLGAGLVGTGGLQPMVAAGPALTGNVMRKVRGDGGGERCVPRAWATAGRDVEFQPAPGEVIALISGSTMLTAHLTLVVEEVYRQAEALLGAFTLSCEAAWVRRNVFDLRVHAERHVPQEIQANDLTLQLIGDSQWTTNEGRRRTGETVPRIQDSTSVRLVPHQIGIILRELERARKDITHGANSSTCNPLLIPDYAGEGHEFLSSGNWDATVLGHAAQSMNNCLTRLMMLTKDLATRLLYNG